MGTYINLAHNYEDITTLRIHFDITNEVIAMTNNCKRDSDIFCINK